MARHNPHMGNTLLVMAGFAVIVAVMLALTVRGGRQWRRKLDDILLPIGFTRCDAEADKTALAQRLQIVNPRHQGKRLLMHLYRRDAPDGTYALYVGDYRFASAGGRTSGGSWVITALVAPSLALPALAIHGIPQASALATRLARALAARHRQRNWQLIVGDNSERGFTGVAALTDLHPDSVHRRS